MFSFEGCSLDVLYRGLGISKMQFLIKKRNKIFSCIFFSICGHLNPGSISGSGSVSGFVSRFTWNAGSGFNMNPDPQHLLKALYCKSCFLNLHYRIVLILRFSLASLFFSSDGLTYVIFLGRESRAVIFSSWLRPRRSGNPVVSSVASSGLIFFLFFLATFCFVFVLILTEQVIWI
jgi:hypothetical protein